MKARTLVATLAAAAALASLGASPADAARRSPHRPPNAAWHNGPCPAGKVCAAGAQTAKVSTSVRVYRLRAPGEQWRRYGR